MSSTAIEVHEQAAPLASAPARHAPVLDFTGSSLADKWQMADMLSRSQLVPKDFQGKPGDILIVADLGASLAMSVAQSLQTIACIGGRPVIWGDGMLGIARRSPSCEWIKETELGTCQHCQAAIERGSDESEEPVWRHTFKRSIECVDGKNVATLLVDDKYGYRCSAKRRGDPHVVSNEFTIADAKRANLFTKRGPWQEYGPRRMCRMRARSWTLRDAFADALKGLAMREEIVDIPDSVRAAIINAPTRTDALKNALAARAAVDVAPAIDVPPAACDTLDDEIPLEGDTPPATATVKTEEQITAALDAAAATDPDFKTMKNTEIRPYVNQQTESLGLKPWDVQAIEQASPQKRLVRDNVALVLRQAREKAIRDGLARTEGDADLASPEEDQPRAASEIRPLDFAMMSAEQLRDLVEDAAFQASISEATLNIIIRAFAPDGLTADNVGAVIAEIRKRAGSQ